MFVNFKSRQAKVRGFRLVAAYLERDAAQVRQIMAGVSEDQLAVMLAGLGHLAIVTMQTVKLAGGRLPDGVATAVVELVSQVGGIGEAVEIRRQLDAFTDGTLLRQPGDQIDMAAAVHRTAALNAIVGVEWSGMKLGPARCPHAGPRHAQRVERYCARSRRRPSALIWLIAVDRADENV